MDLTTAIGVGTLAGMSAVMLLIILGMIAAMIIDRVKTRRREQARREYMETEYRRWNSLHDWDGHQ